MKTQPTCPNGPLQNKFDYHNMPNGCSLPGVPGTMNNGGSCATDMWNMGGYDTYDLGYQPPGATGGSCSFSATPNPGSVNYAAADTICTPDTPVCTANMPCTPGFGTGYSVCIEQSGTQNCPGTTFTQQHIVGDGSNFMCGNGCGCTFPMNATCTGTVTLWTDNKCMMNPYSVPVSSAGTCYAPMQGIQNNYQSYHYVPDPLPPQTCSTTGSSSPMNLTLTNPVTICCAP